jgi:hypothetical protein
LTGAQGCFVVPEDNRQQGKHCQWQTQQTQLP